VEMEEIQGQMMRVSRGVEGLQRVNDLKNRRVNFDVNPVNGGAFVIRGDKPDRRRPEADAPAFSYDAGAACRMRLRFDWSDTTARNLLYCNYAFNEF